MGSLKENIWKGSHKMEPLVCVILINYNSYDDTIECVQSLKAQDYVNYKIIVVDNCSNDQSRLKVNVALNAECDIILSKKNDGFAAGNNIGIRYAQKKYNPDYYWVLNNDTIVERDCLKRLINTVVGAQKNVGLGTGRIMHYYNREKIDYRGGFFDNKTGTAGYYSVENTPEREISFATGCFWLLPRKTIETIGLLSEEYFMYAEDTDYCCRIIRAGYAMIYCDDSVIYHKISASNGVNSPFNQFYMTRNGLYIIKKYSRSHYIAYLKFIKKVVVEIVKKQRTIKPTFDAIVAFMHHELGRNKEY